MIGLVELHWTSSYGAILYRADLFMTIYIKTDI